MEGVYTWCVCVWCVRALVIEKIEVVGIARNAQIVKGFLNLINISELNSV